MTKEDEDQLHGSFIVDSVLKQLGVNKEQIEKVKKIIDMIEIDDDEVNVLIGDNVKIKIDKH